MEVAGAIMLTALSPGSIQYLLEVQIDPKCGVVSNRPLSDQIPSFLVPCIIGNKSQFFLWHKDLGLSRSKNVCSVSRTDLEGEISFNESPG